jgi:hypothetical protein
VTGEGSVNPRFSFGQTVTDMFRIIGRNFLLLAGLAVLLSGIPNAIFMLATFGSIFSGATDLGDLQGFFVNLLIAGLAGAILGIFAQAAIVFVCLVDPDKQPPGFVTALAAGLRFFVPILVITLVYYLMMLAVIAGPVALIFVGRLPAILIVLVAVVALCVALFLAICFLVAAPAAIAEQRGGFDALGRSWELTTGHRWKLLGMLLLYGFVISMVSGAINGAMMPAMMLGAGTGQSFSALGPVMAAQALMGSLTLVLTYPALSATYSNLRVAKEGIRQDSISDIFG